MASLSAFVAKARRLVAAVGRGRAVSDEAGHQIIVDAAVLAELRRLAAQARPYELCGLLRVGRRAGSPWVRGARLLPNRASNPVRGFRLTRGDVDRTRSEWQHDRGGLPGVFHSHGICDATPSAHDVTTMRRQPGLHLIIGATGDLRLFVNDAGALAERAVTVR